MPGRTSYVPEYRLQHLQPSKANDNGSFCTSNDRNVERDEQVKNNSETENQSLVCFSCVVGLWRKWDSRF